MHDDSGSHGPVFSCLPCTSSPLFFWIPTPFHKSNIGQFNECCFITFEIREKQNSPVLEFLYNKNINETWHDKKGNIWPREMFCELWPVKVMHPKVSLQVRLNSKSLQPLSLIKRAEIRAAAIEGRGGGGGVRRSGAPYSQQASL